MAKQPERGEDQAQSGQHRAVQSQAPLDGGQARAARENTSRGGKLSWMYFGLHRATPDLTTTGPSVPPPTVSISNTIRMMVFRYSGRHTEKHQSQPHRPSVLSVLGSRLK